jgi:hypothetical protein
MSGFSKKPDIDPDISDQKPDIWPPEACETDPGFSQSSQYSEFATAAAF